MAIKETLDTLYLCWFSHPKGDRDLFTYVRRSKPTAIVEVGMESAERTLRLLRLAQRVSPGQTISYSAIDLFDARPLDRATVTLKAMHQLLTKTGAQVRLIPGDPLSALARAANQLSGTQLLIVSADVDPMAMERAWMYIPRMLASPSVVLVSGSSGVARQYTTLPSDEWERLAAEAGKTRRAAA